MVEEIGFPKDEILVKYFAQKKKARESALPDGQKPFSEILQLKIEKVDANGKSGGVSAARIDDLDPKSAVAAVRQSIDELKKSNHS